MTISDWKTPDVGDGPEEDFGPVEGFNIQVKTVFLETDCFRVVRYDD